MAKVTPIGEQLQQVLPEMKESFWGEGAGGSGASITGTRRVRGWAWVRGMPCARPAVSPLD